MFTIKYCINLYFIGFDIKYNRVPLDYELLSLNEKIGEGSSGIIYDLSNNFVIKVLKEGHHFEYDFYNLYIKKLNESYISNMIGLPISLGMVNDKHFIILNKFKKFNISLVNGITTEHKIIRLIYNLLVIENYLETELQFVNLDFKLNNIMLDINNNIKVIDFGLIKNFSNDDVFFFL